MNNNDVLINLPYFDVPITREFGEPSTFNAHKVELIFYYLNFKNREDLELFKLNIAGIAVDKEFIRVFVIKEGSYGFEEIKKYSNQYLRQLVLEIRNSEYNDPISRSRLQDIITQLITVPPNFPQITPEDIISTLAEGRNFVTGSYPENTDPSDYNFTSAVKSILQKKDLLKAENLVLIVMIKVNPDADSYLNTTEGLTKEFEDFHEFFYPKTNNIYVGFYYFLFDDVDTAFSISIIATDTFTSPIRSFYKSINNQNN